MVGRVTQLTDKQSATYVQLLDLAEARFGEKGYAGVSLRELANELGIKHASLYHHVPGGKQQLYVAVMERTLQRYRAGIQEVMNKTQGDIATKLLEIAVWLLEQPPFDYHRMTTADLTHIDPEHQRSLTIMAFHSFQQPIRDVLLLARENGEITVRNLDLAAMMFLGEIQALHNVPFQYTLTSKEAVAEEIIDLLLNGWRKR
jgi:AcrR family transcriptional regulator